MTPTTIHLTRPDGYRLYANGAHVVSQSLLDGGIVALAVNGATYYVDARDYWRAVAGHAVDAERREEPRAVREAVGP